MRLRYGLLLPLLLAAAGCETEEVEPDAAAPEARIAPGTGASPAPPAEESVELEPAPDFTLPGPGGDFSLSDHRGHVVVLNFWATWNDLSLEGMAPLADLHRALAGEGLVVVGVAQDEAPAAALEAWVDGHDAPPYPLVADTAGAVAEAYGGIALLPTTVVVDRDGRLRAHHTGILSEDELLDLLAPVLIEDDEPLTDVPVAAPGVIKPLSADEAEALVRAGAVLVDLRTEEVRSAAGALPYALHRPAGRLTAYDLPANFATPLIFADEDGSAAGEAAGVALGWGYVAVYRLDGGVAAWAAAGLPLEPVPAPPAVPGPASREAAPTVVPTRSVLG